MNNTTTQKDSKRYFNNFIKEILDYSKLSNIDFYIKYVVGISELQEIKDDYEEYLSWHKEAGQETLDYKEWLEQVFYEENQDDIEQAISEHKDPLEVITYKTKDNGYSIYEITLTYGGPNIYLTMNSRWNKATYEFYWGGDDLKEDISYLYEELETYFSYITEQ